MSEELKPCPVCGTKAVEIIPIAEFCQVVCWNCLMRGSARLEKIDAIKAWNYLCDVVELKKQIARLKAERDEFFNQLDNIHIRLREISACGVDVLVMPAN